MPGSLTRARWSAAPIRAPGRADLPFIAATALFLAVFITLYWQAGLRRVGDSGAYALIAASPLDAAGLLRRPPLYPLLLRALGGGGVALVRLQGAAYAAAWIFFARSVTRGLAPAAAAAVALLAYYAALWPDFAGWTPIMLTESLSVSLSVAAIAVLVRLSSGGTWRGIGALVLLCAANTLLRDLNGAAALLLVLPLGVLVAARRIWRAAGAAAMAGLLGCAVLVAVTAALPAGQDRMARRFVFPLLNVMGQRVLPDPDMVQRLVAAGMPVTPALRAMTGKMAPGRDWAFYDAPALAPFRAWLLKHGRAAYARAVLARPVRAAGAVVGARAELLDLGAADHFAPYRGAAAVLPLPRPGLGPIYAGGLALSAWLVLRRRHVAGALCLSLYAGMPVLAALAYWGDAMELGRHALILPLYAVLLALAGMAFSLSPRRDAAGPE